MAKECTNCSSEQQEFPSHEKEISRMNRAIGQMEGVKKMITDRRYCPDILIQLKAIHSAIKSIEKNILQSHVESCVANSLANKDEKEQKIKEIIALLDKFQS